MSSIVLVLSLAVHLRFTKQKRRGCEVIKMHREGRAACECAISYPDLLLVFGGPV